MSPYSSMIQEGLRLGVAADSIKKNLLLMGRTAEQADADIAEHIPTVQPPLPNENKMNDTTTVIEPAADAAEWPGLPQTEDELDIVGPLADLVMDDIKAIEEDAWKLSQESDADAEKITDGLMELWDIPREQLSVIATYIAREADAEAEAQPTVAPVAPAKPSFEIFVPYEENQHALRRSQVITYDGMRLLRQPVKEKDVDAVVTYHTKSGRYPDRVVRAGDAPEKASWPSRSSTNKLDQEFYASVNINTQLSEYADAIEEADETKNVDSHPYPVDAWVGTPYYDFAMLCHGSGETENNIPLGFLINGLLTYVGAIAGHRIAPEFSPLMPAHFYTLFRSKRGGNGKNEVMNWCKLCFDETSLMYQSGIRFHKNIGMYHNDFASARALIEQFAKYPSILQEYGEFTTAIEKFGITGSGTSFLDFNLNQYDTTRANWSLVKGMKLPESLPPHINNSILAATTDERWNETAGKVNLETFIQRTNIVLADDVRTVFNLHTPDVSELKKVLLSRIGLLESYKLLWRYSPEALEVGKEWHERIQDSLMADDDPDAAEAVGRLQVFAHRIVGHLALWLGELPKDANGNPAKVEFIEPRETVDLDTGEKFLTHLPVVKRSEHPDKIWEVEVTGDMMRRAIDVCEYLVWARLKSQALQGFGRAQVENLIKKWASQLKTCRWNDLKRKGNLRKYSVEDCTRALKSIQSEGLLTIRANPTKPSDPRGWIITWVGDGQRSRKWLERRGGHNRKTIQV